MNKENVQIKKYNNRSTIIVASIVSLTCLNMIITMVVCIFK